MAEAYAAKRTNKRPNASIVFLFKKNSPLANHRCNIMCKQVNLLNDTFGSSPLVLYTVTCISLGCELEKHHAKDMTIEDRFMVRFYDR